VLLSNSILCLSLLSIGLQAAPTPPTLADLTRLADPIAIVRFEQVHSFEHGQFLAAARASVERCLLGRSSDQHLVLVWKRSELEESAAELAQGSRALVFVDPRTTIGPDEAVSKWLAKRIGPQPPRDLLPGGLWRLDDSADGSAARIPTTVHSLPDAWRRSAIRGSVPSDELLAWLDAELDRITPSAGATWVTTSVGGPGGGFHIELGPEGEFHGTEQGRMSSEQLAHFWQTVQTEKFRELPDLVGKCKYPDQSSFTAWTRDRSGQHSVRIFCVSPDDLESDSARGELDRALRVWRAFPGSTRPEPPQ